MNINIILPHKENYTAERAGAVSLLVAEIKNRSKCFDYIIELCHRRIRNVASYSGQNTFYEIPGLIIGYPLYNLQECITYVVDALRKNGFLIQILPPPNVGVMYISWDPRELHAQKSIKSAAATGPPGILPQQLLHNNNNNIRKSQNTPKKAQNTTSNYREQMKLF